MQYVVADLHGCYQAFLQLLDTIHFSKKDELYLLGDMVDRGPEPIPLLQDLMLRPNVYPILGNHDYMALTVLKKLSVEITPENVEGYLSSEDLFNWSYWMRDGGKTTAEGFSKLGWDEKQDLLDYLSECSLYEEVFTQHGRYLLVHAGIRGFSPDKALETYHFSDFLFERADYNRRYFSDPKSYLVTGHTPTMNIRPDGRPEVYQEHGHIAMDCGCVFGGQLAAYCFDTQEIFYVPSGLSGQTTSR